MLRKFVCLSILLAVLPLGAAAQDPPEVLYYSRLTSTFDGLPPIGKRFQIKGYITQEVLAVEVESFGFQGTVPTELMTPDAFCEARSFARSRATHDVTHARLSWERAQQETDRSASQFTVNHPRLYYGRKYVFLFTYYHPLDEERQREIARQTLIEALESHPNLETLAEEGLSGDGPGSLDEELRRAFRSLSVNTCPNALLDRDSKQPIDVFKLFETDIMQTIASRVTEGYKRRLVERVSVDLELLLPVLDQLPDTLQTQVETLKRRVAEARQAADGDSATAHEKWSAAAEAAVLLLGRLEEDSDERARLEPLVQALTDIAFGRSATRPAQTIPQLVDKILEEVQFRDVEQFLSATLVNPYVQTLEERRPFLVSLDGGLSYVARFEEVIPVLALNIKFKGIDFDDPLNRKREYSALIGVGLASPDDLDPDYRGIFGSTGDRSLVLGFGVRDPRVSELIRLQIGVLLYKQQNKNPLIDDAVTYGSFYVGLSMNWDVIDSATGLFRSTSNFSIGG